MYTRELCQEIHPYKNHIDLLSVNLLIYNLSKFTKNGDGIND